MSYMSLTHFHSTKISFYVFVWKKIEKKDTDLEKYSFKKRKRETATAKLLQSCPTLCDPIDSSPSGFPIPRIIQARTLEWVAISFSSAWKWKVKTESEVAQMCPTLSDTMDCSLPGSSVDGIFQARVLEWGAIAFSGERE